MWQIVDMMLAERARQMAEDAERQRLVASVRRQRRRRRTQVTNTTGAARRPGRATGSGSTPVQDTP